MSIMKNYLLGLALVVGASGCYKLEMLGERQVLHVKTQLYDVMTRELHDTIVAVQAPVAYVFSPGENIALQETCCDKQGEHYYEYIPNYTNYMKDIEGTVVEILQ